MAINLNSHMDLLMRVILSIVVVIVIFTFGSGVLLDAAQNFTAEVAGTGIGGTVAALIVVLLVVLVITFGAVTLLANAFKSGKKGF